MKKQILILSSFIALALCAADAKAQSAAEKLKTKGKVSAQSGPGHTTTIAPAVPASAPKASSAEEKAGKADATFHGSDKSDDDTPTILLDNNVEEADPGVIRENEESSVMFGWPAPPKTREEVIAEREAAQPKPLTKEQQKLKVKEERSKARFARSRNLMSNYILPILSAGAGAYLGHLGLTAAGIGGLLLIGGVLASGFLGYLAYNWMRGSGSGNWATLGFMAGGAILGGAFAALVIGWPLFSFGAIALAIGGALLGMTLAPAKKAPPPKGE